MSKAPKFLSPLSNKLYSMLKNANGAAAYKKAAKKLGISFLDVAPMLAAAKAYNDAYVWDADSLDSLDWSAFNPA